MTAVASPPSIQPLQRLGWNNDDGDHNGPNPVSAEEVSRIFLRPHERKLSSSQRSNSTSSLSSESSVNTTLSTSGSTKTAASEISVGLAGAGRGKPATQNGEKELWSGTRKPKSLWPAPKAESTIAGTGFAARSVPSAAKNGALGSVSSIPVSNMQDVVQAGGGRVLPHGSGGEPQALLSLLPLNGTFERKSIAVPLFPEILRIGRQTNAKTQPTSANGYFDSKVLSRQHAEVWADRNGRIWIRDVKSSNGTFVNGTRLSPESRDSEPHELREGDQLELGIDIVSEDQKSIVHHKVSAKVEHAGFPSSSSNVMDLSFGDLDPGANSGLITSSFSNGAASRSRLGSQSSLGSVGKFEIVRGPPPMGVQKHMNAFLAPVTVEVVMKKLNAELRQAKQQSHDLHRTGEYFAALLATEPGQEPPKAPASILPPKPQQTQAQAQRVVMHPRWDASSPFSAPPAPPPQIPLPDRPDGSRSAHADNGMPPMFRRTSTDPSLAKANSEQPSSGQILSLVDTLTSTRRELDMQGTRIKELEEMLLKERKAREMAEERARLLSKHHSVLGSNMDTNRMDPFTPPSEHNMLPNMNGIHHEEDDSSETASIAETVIEHKSPQTTLPPEEASHETINLDVSTSRLQERLNEMVREMEDLQQQLDEQRSRATTAETERDSLMDMVQRIRQAESTKPSLSKNKAKAVSSANEPQSSESQNELEFTAICSTDEENEVEEITQEAMKAVNGKPPGINARKDQRIQELQEALALALARAAESQGNDRLTNSAPYMSMIGVVILGVSTMLYLNGWQKLER